MSSLPLRSNKDPNPAPPEQPCKHPRVQVVSHDDDGDYVECVDCREVFEASEFRDMQIEEKLAREADS